MEIFETKQKVLRHILRKITIYHKKGNVNDDIDSLINEQELYNKAAKVFVSIEDTIKKSKTLIIKDY